MEDKGLICCKCNKKLEPKTTHFTYLGHSFSTEILKCPVCGEVFIDEELVKGRIALVETELEDK
ncbi:MAG: DNA-binding protein [Tissierellia bacterium]|jgi:uncharacterized protein (DUF2225 family)|nr:DNA-binding protein [Tissierellia bacterium]